MPFTPGPKTDQGGAAALQRGGRDAEGAAAPQHCPLLRFLGVCAAWKEVHCARYRTDDFRNSQNVSTVSFYLLTKYHPHIAASHWK